MKYLFLAPYLTVILFSCHTAENASQSTDSKICFWYGETQSFGTPGLAQRWINILGNVDVDIGITSLHYSLNGADIIPLSWGQDNHRLANHGDFNIEILYRHINEGRNEVVVTMVDSSGIAYSKSMEFVFKKNITWPLPYTIDWEKVEKIQDVAQVVDGNWKLTPEGIRTLDPWYDRIIAVGDSLWRNYEITTSVIFHGYTSPVKDPPNYGVSHAALATRWPGHDWDHNQPHLKWYPLGATCEFQLKDDLDSCRWRILGGSNIKTEDTYQNLPIRLGVKYFLKSRVENVDRRNTRYRVKIWTFGEPEPEFWQLTAVEGPDDLQYGSALLIAHNTDVTFGNINVMPLE
jgi:hypothetical protein